MARRTTKSGSTRVAKRSRKQSVRRRRLKKTTAHTLHKEAVKALSGRVAGSSKKPSSTSMRGFTATAARRALAPGSNRRLLDQILGGHYPDDTPLDPPFDSLARAGLAARIRRLGVLVDPAVVIACDTVGCVHAEMNRVNRGGR